VELCGCVSSSHDNHLLHLAVHQLVCSSQLNDRRRDDKANVSYFSGLQCDLILRVGTFLNVHHSSVMSGRHGNDVSARFSFDESRLTMHWCIGDWVECFKCELNVGLPHMEEREEFTVHKGFHRWELCDSRIGSPLAEHPGDRLHGLGKDRTGRRLALARRASNVVNLVAVVASTGYLGAQCQVGRGTVAQVAPLCVLGVPTDALLSTDQERAKRLGFWWFTNAARAPITLELITSRARKDTNPKRTGTVEEKTFSRPSQCA